LRRSTISGRRSTRRSRSNWSFLNWFHSVAITTPSAPSAASYELAQNVTSGRSVRQASIAAGSYARTAQPLASSARTTATAGDSRTSSVSALNESPSTAAVAPASVPNADSILCSMRRCVCSLTASTASTMRSSPPLARAMRATARVSLGKHEPPKPGPGCRNWLPMRASRPMPLATTSTSAPSASHSSAISLMNEILAARNELDAYFTSSALSTSVVTNGTPALRSGE
jgi:hypothetical protein